MSKVNNPTTLSGYFGIDPDKLNKLGVLDPTLAIDTKLFIDPLLFQDSKHPEIQKAAVDQYRSRFETIIRFLGVTKKMGDVPWRTAQRLFKFPEIPGTCLGYGAASIHGSAFGPELTDRLLRVGKEIVDLGITDPDLFPAMALFEAGIGPDRISDMVTNVIMPQLVLFNKRILDELDYAGDEHNVAGARGLFFSNPLEKNPTPIILVPKDILRSLPIVNDWDGIADAAAKNEELRSRVNEHIGQIWAVKTKRDKQKLQVEVLRNKAAFQALLDAIHGVPRKAYDVDQDPEGLINWAQTAKIITDKFPLNLLGYKSLTNLNSVYELVKTIVEQYKQLIENNGLNKELYIKGKSPRHERTAQRLFFAIAYSYCKANNVDISPETDSGTGAVDFKFSKGFDARVLVEIKLSTNNKLPSGYETQLETYKKSERTMKAFFIVIDVGQMGKKLERVTKLRNDASRRREPLSDIVYIDGIVKPSASKR